jgi:hypothetical protein
MTSNAKWTDDDDRRLLELKAGGKTDRAIGEILGRSGSAVEQRVYIMRNRARPAKTVLAE